MKPLTASGILLLAELLVVDIERRRGRFLGLLSLLRVSLPPPGIFQFFFFLFILGNLVSDSIPQKVSSCY